MSLDHQEHEIGLCRVRVYAFSRFCIGHCAKKCVNAFDNGVLIFSLSASLAESKYLENEIIDSNFASSLRRANATPLRRPLPP